MKSTDPQPLPATCATCPHVAVDGTGEGTHWYVCGIDRTRPLQWTGYDCPPPSWCPLREEVGHD